MQTYQPVNQRKPKGPDPENKLQMKGARRNERITSLEPGMLPQNGFNLRELTPGNVAQLQRAIGNREVGRLLRGITQPESVPAKMTPQDPGVTNSPESNIQPKLKVNEPGDRIQRQVRINGGATRVNEAEYRPGGSKSSIGSRYPVANLIGDSVRRVFTDVGELERYANGQTDYIGDVATASGQRYWYRLPENQLTVLGEIHSNPNGEVEDVILGLHTSRFKYEPFNEMVSTTALNTPFTGTQSRLAQVNSGQRIAGMVNRASFNPDLENIVFKALTGAMIFRNEYLPANPSTMNATQRQVWGRRATTRDYSYGERVALYLSMGIHIASDIAQHNFGPPNFVESLYVMSGRHLKDYYVQNQTVLDQFMQTKDGDDLIGIYELTQPNNFQSLPIIEGFVSVFHEYASYYIEQLGVESGNTALQNQGQALLNNPGATIDDLSPAREEIMWEKIQQAATQGFLLVGMGDAHHRNLEPRLNQAGIPHDEVEASLKRQKREVNARWRS